MSLRRRLSIAVVGAGIGGLAVALRLAEADHDVIVHERFEASRPVGSGLMLQPTGLAALRRLGLIGEITALGEQIHRLHGVTDRGATVFNLAYTDLAPGLHAVAVHRALLHGVLWRAFERSAASLETSRNILDLVIKAGGRASLLRGDGKESAAFDIVIDASGANSLFRRHVGSQTAKDFVYGAVWATAKDLGVNPGALTQRYVRASEMIGHLPTGRLTEKGERMVAIFWSLKSSGHMAWRQAFEAWRTKATKLWPEIDAVLASFHGPDDFAFAGYRHFTARRPFAGPLALIGDAAHSTSPQLGQGANNALLDAHALADAIETSPSIEIALASYHARRTQHVRLYQFASAAMTPFFQSDSHVLPLIRNALFDRLRFLPFARREMVRLLAGLKTGIFSHRSPEDLAGG